MNYYERHLGDYAKDTGHLTMLEHGAYTLLLDRYYSTEQGIPADQAHRIARARTKEERAAVDTVLAEFFDLADGVWTKGRVEEEIEAAAGRINAAKTNGKKGGRPKKQNPTGTQEKPSGFSLGSKNETQPKAHQTPDTNHQSPEEIQDTHTATVVARVDPVEDDRPVVPTMAGAVCITLRAKGIASVNPSHPDLLALLAAGVDVGAFASAAEVAVERGHARFPYVLGVVKGQQADAQRMAAQAASAPAKPQSRVDRQLETAAGLTGSVRRQPAKEVVDVDVRVIPS